MVKINYSSKEQVDVKNGILAKRENVKGLAKKVFGFWRVVDSVADEGVCLNTLFSLGIRADIGTINVEDNSMRLYKNSYQQKAEQFARAYQDRFMNNKDEFVINTTYS